MCSSKKVFLQITNELIPFLTYRVALEDLDRSESSVQREYQDLKKRHELNRRSSHGSVSEASAYDPGFDALDDQQPSPEEHQEHP